MTKKWHIVFLIGIAILLQDCKKSCDDGAYYLFGATANDLRKFSFMPGSYWVYTDSASGTIDSLSVYSYFAQTDAVTGSYPQTSCPIYADIANTRVRLFTNGIFSSYFTYYGHGTLVETEDSAGFPAHFDSYYYINGRYIDTLYQYTVLGNTYLQVYKTADTIAGPPTHFVDVYFADYTGVIKRVDRDSINGTKTWELRRSHLINP